MESIKKILADPLEITKYHIILTGVLILFCVLISHSLLSITVLCLDGIIFSLYFLYLKTESGKKNFDTANKIISYILFITIVGIVVLLISRLKYYHGISLLTYFATQAINIGFCIYWIYAFFVTEEKNQDFFQTKVKNETFCQILIWGTIILDIITYLLILDSGWILKYLIQSLIQTVLTLCLFILRVRYIYLYQNHKEERRKK